jgi:NADH:ubiquinone oxidoreductase subunit
MYYIVQYVPSTKVTVTCAETSNPAEAYEMAHSWDAWLHFGRDEGSEVLPLDATSFVGIVDENGNDCWRECCEARCPSVGLFHTAE